MGCCLQNGRGIALRIIWPNFLGTFFGMTAPVRRSLQRLSFGGRQALAHGKGGSSEVHLLDNLRTVLAAVRRAHIRVFFVPEVRVDDSASVGPKEVTLS